MIISDSMMQPFASAVIVAAGKGERFGDGGKVLAPVGGRPVLAWSLDAYATAKTIREIVIVAGEHTLASIRDVVAQGSWTTPVSITMGGNVRQDSMINGVRATSDKSEVVLVHDAARPMIRADQIDAVAMAAKERGAAILADVIGDTLKRADADVIVETVDRTNMWGAQTPQGFGREVLLGMCEQAQEQGADFTDEASLAEMLNIPVYLVRGDRLNIKITWPEDLAIIDALLRQRLEKGL